MKKLSVVLATRNEEANIGSCLDSVKGIADEIVIVDEGSTDKTRKVAESYGAKVYKVKHQPIFHKTKQKAIDKASGDWILQLDADERVTPQLAKEIIEVLELSDLEIRKRRPKDKKKWRLFKRHQKVLEQRDGKIGKDTGEIVAFFIPRLNFFLRKPLRYAGVYPDANIRLVKKGKAHFPAKSVHEQMEIDGEVAWLFNDLEHHDSPTLKRYLERANRYTDLHAKELERAKVSKSCFQLLNYSTTKPLFVFFNLYFRHKGILDGMRGFLWSLFSALHYPVAYFKYWQESKK
jgi:glycosyltransferase involved in cell wall biosynthesis